MPIKNFTKPVLLLLVYLIWCAGVGAATIDVVLDRTTVSMDESFQIIFTANGSVADAPDFSPMERDFTILGQSQSSNVLVVNGQMSNKTQWVVNAMPKKTGRLSIPAIKFGQDVSSPLVVTVDNNKKDVNQNADLFLDIKVDKETPYVQEQVIYTLRIYSKVEFTDGKAAKLELKDAMVQQLTNYTTFSTLHHGSRYDVTEIKYAIFPQKSGELVINPVEFTANIVTNERSFTDPFYLPPSKTVRVTSKKIALNVKPALNQGTGRPWLPAEDLQLKQEWSGDMQQAKIGEPLTRTISLQVQGSLASQLPEINVAKSDDVLKVYPDQPVLKEEGKPQGLSALRQEKIAFIPSKPGSFTIPAIEIPWFNTKTQRMEIANLPATTINVAGKTMTPETAQPPVPVSNNQEVPANKTEMVQTTVPSRDTHPQKFLVYNKWLWAACVLLAAGWVITLIYFFSKKPKIANKQVVLSEEDISTRESIKQLKKACQNNDVLAAKATLLAWGSKQFNATSLGAIAPHCEARLRDEILALNQILYGKEAEANWDGKKLFQYFIENKARAAIVRKDDSLEPLYRL